MLWIWQINIMLILDEKFIINIVYFHFSSSKLVKQCFDELFCKMTTIWFLPTLITCNMSQIIAVHIGQFIVNEIYSCICLGVFPVLWHFKKLNHNHRHYDFKWMYSETYLIRHSLWEAFGEKQCRITQGNGLHKCQ